MAPATARTMERRLAELIGDANTFDDLGEFRTGLTGLLRRAVPCAYAAYNEVDDDPSRTWAILDPPRIGAPMEAFARYAHENPLYAYMRRTRDGRPRRISDFMTTQELHATSLYRECYAVMGVESQVAFTLPSRPPVVVGIALSRGPEDFADDEMRLLAAARPHLIQAYRAIELSDARAATLATLAAGLDSVANPLLVVDRHGRIEFATPAARRLLNERLGLAADAVRLPDAVRAALDARRERGTAAAEPLLVGPSDAPLTLRVLPGASSAEPALIALEPGSGGMSTATLQGLGLTAREAEALRWIALGRSGREAAGLMAISPRTVEKHLQHVYAKLGVANGSQAAATAWAAVGVRRPDAADLA